MPDPARTPRSAPVTLLAMILALSAGCFAIPATLAQESPPHAAATEAHHVLVIPVNIQGCLPVVAERHQIAQALFSDGDSVASRYRAVSYGKIDFVGSGADIAGAVALAEPADFCDKGLGRLARAAVDAARRRGTQVAAYQHFVFLVPSDVPCPWTGVGDIGGNRVWVKAATARALQHELGHNLGMDHAVHWHGSGADGSDFMGSGAAGLNAPHVVAAGWLDGFGGKVVELHEAAEVTLEALEADPRRSALPKVAIVRPSAGANTYYLSYRAASAGNPLPAEATKGLNIHVFNKSGAGGRLTYLVTTLADGAAYEDGPMSVSQVSHIEGAQVTFRVGFARTAQAAPAGPPTAPPGTVQSLASGKCLDLARGSTADGAPVIQYDCHPGPNQQWTVETASGGQYRIVSRLSGKCLGIDRDATASERPLVHSVCGASPDQLWLRRTVGDGYVFENFANRKCLDVPGASSGNGVRPITWNCNAGANQIWRYTP